MIPRNLRIALSLLAIVFASLFALGLDRGGLIPAVQPAHAQTPLRVTGIEPAFMTAGEARVLSIFGENFTASTTVRLTGFGLLSTTFINPTAMTAAVPASIGPGIYAVEVSDPANGSAASPTNLTVSAPTSTPQAPTTPQPLPTFAPPTPVPGQPSLVVRRFSASPASIPQGGTTTLTFEIVNQGNRTAEGVTVTLGSDAEFAPANGQASVLIPNIPPGGTATVNLAVVASVDAPAGPNNVPIAMSYRDFTAESFTSSATLGVEVTELNLMTQLVIARSRIEPSQANPGQEVLISLTVTNTGNAPARGALIRLTGDNSVLIPGSGGDTYTLGDIEPRDSVDVTFPAIVRGDARAGAQAQRLTITYMNDGEAVEQNSTITINVGTMRQPQPVILLGAFDTGREELRPGDRFTLSFTLLNVGQADAREMLVTFGSLNVSEPSPQQPSSPPSGDGGQNPNPGSGSGSGSSGGDSSSSSSNSNVFAPIGMGNTMYFDALPANGELTLQQEFIVNANVTSGIQTLPISVRYRTPSGGTGTATLPAGLLVLVPPRLQVDLSSPLPPSVNAGEPLPIGFDIANIGRGTEIIQTAEIVAENGEVVEGAQTAVGALRENDDTSISGMIMPSAAGTLNFTLRLHYLNDVDQLRTLEYPYSVEVIEPPPPMPIEEPPPFVPVVEPTPEPDNLLGRLLLGLLGLGG